jgi:urease accessory protein
MSHSFGLETLVFDEDIRNGVRDCPGSLRSYIEDSLSEVLFLDGVFCREAHKRGRENVEVRELNENLSALRLARESREASLAIGRRFAALAATMNPTSSLLQLSTVEELHYPVAFGYTLGVVGTDADLTVGGFLHQSVLNVISAAQRLLPLGQIHASQIAWDLKPHIAETVNRTRDISWRQARSFGHLAELASMRHCCLPSRLFIS